MQAQVSRSRSLHADCARGTYSVVCGTSEKDGGGAELEWPGEDYRLLDFNCQTFALELCNRLGVQDSIPQEYVRHGDVADWMRRSLTSAVWSVEHHRPRTDSSPRISGTDDAEQREAELRADSSVATYLTCNSGSGSRRHTEIAEVEFKRFQKI